MPFFIFLFSFIFSAQALPENLQATFKDEVYKALPKELIEVDGKNSYQDIKKSFGKKITKQESDTLYLNYFSKDHNDVTIGFKNDRVSYVLIKPSKEIELKLPGLFEKIYSQLSDKEKEEIEEGEGEVSHEKGRFITLKLPLKKMSLIFVARPQKKLDSIIIDKSSETGR